MRTPPAHTASSGRDALKQMAEVKAKDHLKALDTLHVSLSTPRHLHVLASPRDTRQEGGRPPRDLEGPSALKDGEKQENSLSGVVGIV